MRAGGEKEAWLEREGKRIRRERHPHRGVLRCGLIFISEIDIP